ncbi:hypothetical protein GCM10029964_121710 [Kibdelosporangium lantanae]
MGIGRLGSWAAWIVVAVSWWGDSGDVSECRRIGDVVGVAVVWMMWVTGFEVTFRIAAESAVARLGGVSMSTTPVAATRNADWLPPAVTAYIESPIRSRT